MDAWMEAGRGGWAAAAAAAAMATTAVCTGEQLLPEDAPEVRGRTALEDGTYVYEGCFRLLVLLPPAAAPELVGSWSGMCSSTNVSMLPTTQPLMRSTSPTVTANRNKKGKKGMR